MPSRTIATLRFVPRRSLTHFAFCSGNSSLTASSTPRSRPTDDVTPWLSPLSKFSTKNRNRPQVAAADEVIDMVKSYSK